MAGAFLHGVGSVDPDRSGVTLWTRVSGVATDTVLAWSVAGDATFQQPVATGTVTAAAADDHTARVRVDGLPPGPLFYRFEADGARSDVGRTATLPADTDRYCIGVVCCARYGSGWFHAYRLLAALQPDLVVHLGDYIYEDTAACVSGRQQEPPNRLVTLSDYRRRYEQARGDPDLQALHLAAPWVALWDDHELADNAWLRGAAGHDPRRDGDVTSRFEAARRAWWEWAPAPLRPPADPADPADRADPGMGNAAPLDRHLAIGTLCDLLLVDTRATGRQQPVDPRGRPSAEPRDGRRLLDAHQQALLHQRLTTSAARWRVLANQVQIAPLRLGYVPSRRKPYLRRIINPDQWDGYPREREALLALLQGHQISNILALSGDLHATFVRATEDRRRPVLPELTTTSVTSPSFGSHARGRSGLPVSVIARILKVLNRDISFMDLRRHGFSVLNIEPDRIGLDVYLLDRIESAAPPPVEIRRFELRAGHNRITRYT